jgi:Ca2+-binding RTX toxin-like protein
LKANYAQAGVGNGGANRIDGGVGANVLDGGGGNDQLTGNGGHDLFVFRPGSGHDVIADFNAGAAGDGDAIGLEGWNFKTFAEVQSHLTASGEGTVLALSNDDTVVLRGVRPDQLTSSHFLLDGKAPSAPTTPPAETPPTDPSAPPTETPPEEEPEDHAVVGTAGNDTLRGATTDDVLYGMAGEDGATGGAGADGIWGGSGNDHLKGGKGDDLLVGGFGADRMNGGAGDDVLLSRSDAGEMTPAQGGDRVYGAESDAFTATADVMIGGRGADTFRFEGLVNAKEEIVEKHTNDDGVIDWVGVTGENENVHDHWLDGFGADVIRDFYRDEGDTIEISAHTAEVKSIEHLDGDDDGEADYSVITVISQQGEAGAHDEDLLGTITVHGDLVEADDIVLDQAVYGAYERAADLPADTHFDLEDEGVLPNSGHHMT